MARSLLLVLAGILVISTTASSFRVGREDEQESRQHVLYKKGSLTQNRHQGIGERAKLTLKQVPLVKDGGRLSEFVRQEGTDDEGDDSGAEEGEEVLYIFRDASVRGRKCATERCSLTVNLSTMVKRR